MRHIKNLELVRRKAKMLYEISDDLINKALDFPSGHYGYDDLWFVMKIIQDAVVDLVRDVGTTDTPDSILILSAVLATMEPQQQLRVMKKFVDWMDTEPRIDFYRYIIRESFEQSEFNT